MIDFCHISIHLHRVEAKRWPWPLDFVRGPLDLGDPVARLATGLFWSHITETKIFCFSKVKTLTKMCQICLNLYHLDNRFFFKCPRGGPPYPMVIHSLAIEGPLEICCGPQDFKKPLISTMHLHY